MKLSLPGKLCWTVITLIALASYWGAWGQDESSEQPSESPSQAAQKVAIVDISVISDEYQALQEKDAELNAWMNEQHSYLQLLGDFIFLSETNFNEVREILNMARPLPDERNARLDELNALAEQKQSRFAELEAKSPRTAEETDNFSTLQEVRNARQQQLAQLEDSIYQQYEQRVSIARKQLMRNVEAAIDEYAQQNGYDLVLDHSFVLYGGENITRAIIDKLNPQPADETGVGEESEEQ